MVACQVCGTELPERGNLCASCREELPSPPGFCAEQILATTIEPGGAALVDRWGRAHRLEVVTPVGRRPLARGLAILEASISRNHAEIARDREGRWVLQDLGSTNGSSVSDERISGRVVLDGVAQVTFGDVGFYFFPDASCLIAGEVYASTATVRPEDRAPVMASLAEELADGDGDGGSAMHGFSGEAGEESTFAGLPHLAFRLTQPTAGGGGIIEIGDDNYQLTTVQYELMEQLAARMMEDEKQPEMVRGFVPSALLVAELSWDSTNPSEAHLKQLVRRMRRMFEAGGFGNLIESRRGFGYRLRFLPRISS